MSSAAVAAAAITSEQQIVRVLVLPVLRRSWLFHAWTEPLVTQSPAPPANPEAVHWNRRVSASLQQRWALTLQGWKQRFDSTVANQWRGLQSAKEGSFRSYMHKLALLVLSREDPAETFLKGVPKDSRHVQVIYPASLGGRLVRRRLRHLVLQRLQEHRRKAIGWAIVTLPQLPLIVTPFPNLTVYYSIYRYMSHIQAMNGARALKPAFDVSDAQQMMHAYDALRDFKLQHPDSQAEPSTWRSSIRARALAHREERCRQYLHTNDVSGKAPSLVFEASNLLDQLTHLPERSYAPLSDEAVDKISKHYNLPDLQQHYKRARDRAVRGGKGGQDQPQRQTVYRLTHDHYKQYRNRGREQKGEQKKEGQRSVYHHV